MVDIHQHSPWAEVDTDGMYEPACEHCRIFDEPAIASMTQRYNTWHEAAAAAATIIDMLPKGVEGNDDTTGDT